MSELIKNDVLERQRAAKRTKMIRLIIQGIIAVITMLIVLFPIYWMLVSSVKSQ